VLLVLLVQRVLQVRLVLLVPPDQLVLLVPLVQLVQLVQSVQLVLRGTQEEPVLLDLLVQLDLDQPVLPELPDQRDALDQLGLLVTHLRER
jgi:hypothetical protein